MKSYVFGAVLLLLCVGCASQESDRLSPQQTDQIKMEVKAVADSIWAKWEEMDPEGALQYYSGSPDWMCFTSEGSRHDFQFYQNLAADFKNLAIAYKWITLRQDFVFVSRDLVVCAWDGKDEALWKSGDKVTFDPHAYTLVFTRIAGEWKLAYSHDSGIAATEKIRTR